jgi:hypothetical protein
LAGKAEAADVAAAEIDGAGGAGRLAVESGICGSKGKALSLRILGFKSPLDCFCAVAWIIIWAVAKKASQVKEESMLAVESSLCGDKGKALSLRILGFKTPLECASVWFTLWVASGKSSKEEPLKCSC